MKTLLIILFFISSSFKPIPRCLKADVIFLIDQSTSVSTHEGQMRRGIYGFLEKLDISDDEIRVAIHTFNEKTYILCKLSGNKNEIINSMVDIKDAGGSTHMFEALMSAMVEFNDDFRPEAQRIVIVISDGSPSEPIACLAASQELQRRYNAKVYSIFVKGTEPNEPFMQQLSSKDCYMETSYDQLVENIEKLNICL